MLATPDKQMPKTACFGKSDVGLKRGNNEDAFVVKPELGLCLAADGMGGAAAGELASRIFAKTTLQVFSTIGGRSEKETIRLVRQAFALAGYYLGIGLSIAINFLNPEKILLGGAVMAAGDFLLFPALEEAKKRSYKASFACCKIEKASLGNKAGLIGAALWAKEQARLNT